jgi:hypothetical protein
MIASRQAMPPYYLFSLALITTEKAEEWPIDETGNVAYPLPR